jgi:hypothetical protein
MFFKENLLVSAPLLVTVSSAGVLTAGRVQKQALRTLVCAKEKGHLLTNGFL